MIELQEGDVLKADTEALVNTVNCVGIMGRGIALQFRNAFPENYRVYKAACDREEVRPGRMLVFDLGPFHEPRYVINFPTKRHWKGKSRLEDIESGLQALVEEVRKRGIRSIAIPPLGCGLGGLQWDDVRPMIEAAFRSLPEVRVIVFEPGEAPATATMAKPKTVPSMTTARAALLSLMRRYLAAVMDPFVSLLEIHKLMYFLQEAGEPLKLSFAKGHYGPYAENLRHLLRTIEGHFISGYGDGSDDPTIQIEMKESAASQAERILEKHPATRQRLQRVADLMSGFETPYGMELLATAHWVGAHEGAGSADDAVKKSYAWNQRKKMFQEPQIRLAWDVLSEKAWLSGK